MTATMEAVVIVTSDVDCDGIGTAWHRYSVPEWLYEQWRDASSKLLIRTNTLKERKREELRGVFPDATPEQMEHMLKHTKLDNMLDRGIVAGIEKAMMAFVLYEIMYEQDRSVPMGLADGCFWTIEEFDARVRPNMEDHDTDYWEREGYHSTFAAR